MSVPQIYFVEPYNAYAPKGRKKHISEIIEEQALLERIIAEANSRTLPPQSPPTSVGTAAGPAVAGGAGGSPLVAYFSPRMTVNFDLSATTGSAPTAIQFSNTSNPDLLALGVATFLWNFGDGTTSSEINPSHTYTTTGSNFAVTLKATSVATGITASVTQSLLISAPTVVANFSVSSSLSGSNTRLTGSAPLTVNFTNLTQTNNSQNSISYLWTFGSGSATSSLATPPNFTYTATGSYTIRLTATGSFGIAASASKLAVLVVT